MSAIALTGGGTAGHITPCLALVPELSKYFERIIYLGGDGMEAELVPAAGLPFFSTPVVKLDRKQILSNFKIPFILMSSAKEAKEILQREKTVAVFGKGGYASLPACLGARSAGIPVIVHESDYSLGVANRFVSRFAAQTLTSFPETEGEYVGNPIRDEIFLGSADRARLKYSLSPERKTVLIFGGSSGATAINAVVLKCARELTKNYNVIHVTGKNTTETLYLPHYISLPYAEDIADLYAVADLVVMRGGANSLAEATALGKRIICIPLPKGTGRGDQMENAKSYLKRNLIDLLPQEELSPDELLKRIEYEIDKPARTVTHSDANKAIVAKILSSLK